MSHEQKKYGLILTTKDQTAVFQPTKNIFGNDSESEDDTNQKTQLQPSGNIKRQTKITQNKAIEEDPTVYQYDEIYDSMTANITKKKINKDEKKPKYIENLLKAANKRKIEYERRIERQIQKEREKEGEEFADKEVFVTSAYKKKLEELQLEEEREKREEYLESIGDVTKQRDLGGFYRQLYAQTLDTTNVTEDTKESISKTCDNKRKDKTIESAKGRNYRKRVISSDNKKQLSDGEIEDTDEEINRDNLNYHSNKRKKDEENIDADSDFSIDETSEDEKTVQKNILNTDASDRKLKSDKYEHNENSKQSEVKEESIPLVEKIDIWKKRTVGEVFDQALQRYYQRKAAKGI